jgi:hypothetical protein
VTLEHYGNWIKETQKLAEDVSRDANARMRAKITGPAESNEHRPDELFGYAFGHPITLSFLVKLIWSLYQSLPYPLVRVAHQVPELDEGTDVWNLGENHIQRCLFVVDQGLVSRVAPQTQSGRTATWSAHALRLALRHEAHRHEDARALRSMSATAKGFAGRRHALPNRAGCGPTVSGRRRWAAMACVLEWFAVLEVAR